MLNETNGAATAARNAAGNGGATAMHLLASGPLFGNLGSATSASTPPALPPFTTPSTAGNDHLTQHPAAAAAAAAAAMAPHNQMLAALAAVAASRNAAAAMPQQQPQHPAVPQQQHQQAEALQALLAHAAAASNGLPPFGMYQPPGMRPGMVGPMTPNFLFDGVGAAGYHPYAMENGRRKNATREVTQPLKVWLEQHHKNPYPTKAEKTVLAIITKMNLTQVSTWFANARRRLKKDNKMTWSPRNNRNADDEDDEDVGSERPSGSPLSTLSDSDARKDSFENSSESGNPNCTNTSRCSDAFLFGNNKHLQQQQQVEGQKKIWSIEGTLSAPQQSPVKILPSACSSADILKTDSKIDISLSSDASARALAAMTAAFMAQQRAAADAKASPPSAGGAEDSGQENLKPPAGLPFGMNPATMAAFSSLAQQQQQQQQTNQQQQQMMMHPLFAFLSQNQRHLQSQQQQQQNILFMVAAAAAAAAKNPQQQQNLFQLQQQQQRQMQRKEGLESPAAEGSEYGATSASVSPASCSADPNGSPAPKLAPLCDVNGIPEGPEDRSRASSAEFTASPSGARSPVCPADRNDATSSGQLVAEVEEGDH